MPLTVSPYVDFFDIPASGMNPKKRYGVPWLFGFTYPALLLKPMFNG